MRRISHMNEEVRSSPDGDFVQPYRPISVLDLVSKERPG